MSAQRKLLALAVAALAASSAHASLSVGSSAYTYTQNFDTLATTGTTNAWANDSTIAGWSLFRLSGAAVTSYEASIGNSNTGKAYSYGAAGSTDRALGSQASGSFDAYIAVSFTNNTGGALSGFNIGFDSEQWRNGGNTTAQSFVLQYGFGSSFAAVTNWSTPGALFNAVSVVNTATAAAVNGNVAGLSAGRGGEVVTDWAAGSTLWIRWADVNDAGNDHGLAIDNVSFSVSAVPEPESYALMLAGLGAVAFMARRRKA